MANRYRDIKTCHVLALDTITDPNRDDLYMIVAEFPEIDYALIYRGTRDNPWVAAWGLENIKRGESWAQGHYFEELFDAMEYIRMKQGKPNWYRMDEIASKAIDKLIENDPYDAEEFLREEIDLDLEEAQYFCIDETLDMIKGYEEEDEYE